MPILASHLDTLYAMPAEPRGSMRRAMVWILRRPVQAWEESACIGAPASTCELESRIRCCERGQGRMY